LQELELYKNSWERFGKVLGMIWKRLGNNLGKSIIQLQKRGSPPITDGKPPKNMKLLT